MAKKKSAITKLQEKSPSDPMARLLAKSQKKPRVLEVGERIAGTVVGVGKKVLIVDIGAKSEGVVSDQEFEAAESFIKTLKPGNKLNVTVLVPESGAGQPLLSVRESSEAQGWQGLEEALKESTHVEARVEGTTRGGLNVHVLGLSGFIPTSQLGAKLLRNPEVSVGRTILAKVVELDRTTNRLVLSEREVSESELIEKQKKVLESIQPGELYLGRVVGVVNFGAFVQITKDSVNLEGLVHLSELSWQKVTDPANVVKPGAEVKVTVIGKEKGRLALSIRRAGVDPWLGLAQKYPADTRVRGVVTKVADAGAFVELEPGVEGLIRSGKLPLDRSLKEGDAIDCFVEDIDVKNHKLSLGVVLKAKPVGYK